MKVTNLRIGDLVLVRQAKQRGITKHTASTKISDMAGFTVFMVKKNVKRSIDELTSTGRPRVLGD